jgi:signal transduction histidine kinase
VTTVVVALIPDADLIYGLPAQQVALQTAASLTTLLAGFLVIGRLRRNSRRNELVLVTALAAIAASNVLFVMLPMLMGPATANTAVWAAMIGRLAGSLLFAVAAFVPRVGLLHPRRTERLAAAGVLGVLALAIAIPRTFGAGLPQVMTMSAGAHSHRGLHVNAALAVVQIAAAVLSVTAAAGYLRRSEQLGDEYSSWLAIAAVVAAAAHVNYAIYPSVYPPQLSLGDIFMFCFYVVLLIGSMREIWSYWQTLVSVSVAEERQRIACDLHDGLSQELAYLTRNLSGLQGTADETTLRQLRVSVDRARLASRQAIHRVAAPARPEVADALAEAAAGVAERLGLDLELDLASGVGLAPAQADALVQIACEALTNVARHSGSRQAHLVLRRDRGRVRLMVRDPGRGFDTGASRPGFGLRSMQARARAVGGELRVSSAPGAGSLVEATL